MLGVVADLQISISRTATVSILKKLGLELNRIMLQLYLDLNIKKKLLTLQVKLNSNMKVKVLGGGQTF